MIIFDFRPKFDDSNIIKVIISILNLFNFNFINEILFKYFNLLIIYLKYENI